MSLVVLKVLQVLSGDLFSMKKKYVLNAKMYNI